VLSQFVRVIRRKRAGVASIASYLKGASGEIMTTIRIEQPSEADLDIIHGFLSQTYWSPDIPRDTVARAWANSTCVIARDESGALIGFARVVSDHATFAWLCDVFVLPAHRGKGVASNVVRALQASSNLQNLRRWLLGTKDAHAVYAPLGFTPLAAPERMMELRNLAPYGKAAG
jgi:GNAT superfamily N-acetyltransferase